MEQGVFCFLKDQYYIDFPDQNLMKNKEMIGHELQNRPCFFAFSDKRNPDILWLIPISSQTEKFQALYEKKVQKHGFCNTIRFGDVLGTRAAFLIQNMCPATEAYVNNIYVDQQNNPIHIDGRIVQDVIKNAREVLSKQERGAFLIFPDVMTIREKLVVQLKEQQQTISSTPLSERLNKARKRCDTQKASLKIQRDSTKKPSDPER